MLSLLKWLFVVLGVGFFAKMLFDYDLSAIWTDLQVVGWGFGWLMLLWFVVVWADTVTWHNNFAQGRKRISVFRLGLIMIASQAVNAVAPTGNLGELVKGKYLAEQIGSTESISSVILFNFFCLIGSVALVTLSAASSFLTPGIPLFYSITLTVVALILAGWTWLLTVLLHRGMAYKLVGWVHKLRLPLKNPEKLLAGAQRVDQAVRRFRTENPREYRIAIAAQLVSRIASLSIGYVACQLLQKPITVSMILFVGGIGQLLGWIFAMIPSQIGILEQTNDRLFQDMRYAPGQGFAYTLLLRGLRIVAIALGLLALLLLSLAKHKSASANLTHSPETS